MNIQTELERILNTSVSEKIIEKLNEAETMKIAVKIKELDNFQALTIKTNQNLWNEDIEECKKVIESILNNGKKRLPVKSHSDKTNWYLQTKFN